MKSLRDEIDTCQSNPEKSSTAKVNKHTTSGYSLFMHCPFDATKSKHDWFRGKDSIICYIGKQEFSTDGKKYYKIRDHSYYTGKYKSATHNVCNLRCKMQKKGPVLFHNCYKYDYHFIIKEIAEESEGQFDCLGERTEKYITFSVPIKKEFENNKTITYHNHIKYIDSFRYMSSSLSSLVDNIAEGLHDCKQTNCKSYFEYISAKNEVLIVMKL